MALCDLSVSEIFRLNKLSAWDYGALKQSETRLESDLWICLRKLRQKISIIYKIFRKRCDLVSTMDSSLYDVNDSITCMFAWKLESWNYKSYWIPNLRSLAYLCIRNQIHNSCCPTSWKSSQVEIHIRIVFHGYGQGWIVLKGVLTKTQARKFKTNWSRENATFSLWYFSYPWNFS